MKEQKTRSWARWLAATIPRLLLGLLPDALALAGAGALTYGAGLAWPPAGWLVGGALLLAAAVVVSKGGVEL